MTTNPTPLPPEGVTLEDINPCPTCGALPCDWANNPHTSAAQAEVEALRELRKEAARNAGAADRARFEAEARATKAEAKIARLREALAPFAAVADEYDDGEDDSFEVWQDAGPIRNIRSTFRLGLYRRARQALDQGAEG